jgi:NAD(P)-dependent dehydrogenase (short-subunit alcohol dehydrogenase family)
MTNPTHLVTGATDGIGLATAAALSRLGARVLVHGRTEARAGEAVARLEAEAPGPFVPVWGDYARLDEVRALVGQVLAAAPTLDVLLNNAGLFSTERRLSADGHELTFQVNHLAPFLLTLGLKGAVLAAPQGRVVNVSSAAHQKGRVDLDDLESARAFDAYRVYAASKLLTLHFTHELARRLQGTRATTSALHPGVITTKLLLTGFKVTGATVEDGARTSVYCATSPELATVSGRYYSDAREARVAPQASQPELEAALWALSERLVGASW